MEPITIGIIIGAVIGLLGGGAAWANDRQNRTQQYQREENEYRQTLAQREENIRTLGEQVRARNEQNRVNREIIDRYEDTARSLKQARDNRREMNNDLRNRRDDRVHEVNHEQARFGRKG